MRNHHTTSLSCFHLCAAALVLAFSAFSLSDSAHAQTTGLAANCSTNPNLPASQTLPVSGADSNPGLNNVNTTACLAASANQDGLKCFTPANSCSVVIIGNGGTNRADTRVAIAAGACSTTPASCTGSGPVNTLVAALTGGTQYCIYVETTSSQLIGYTLTPTQPPSGDCGTLPVELMGFSVDGEAAAGGPR